ncbi:PREDICTED: AP-4 complex subunit epsilon-1 [Dipodomys ordii]|uniref:AP-4 complex subunit epsilon n=1 Tax=Dipodomys ordii TaxID=10020 RepID=A0A1S3EM23_DIPOR|nr:PREDICTED: AP-4 complex subunit epsilon-1 [Dipodomys ordii]
MSDIVEKTLTALPGLFLQNQPVGGSPAAKTSFSSRLGGLIRGITALTSKHEEEKLIQQELNSLKATVSAPTTTLKMMKECMVRLIYCEMLGYDASFGYIHAIKLAQQGNLLEKRVGYLAVSLFLHESHELLLLLVNTVVKDLQSTNLVEICMALTVVSQIFPREMIPAVLPLIEDKLQHSKEIIRRKAVLALYKFHLIAPNQVQHIHIKFRKALCDRDVGVMAASLHIYLRMIKENPSGYKDLTGSFVTILKQVVGGKLPVDFNYHNVPAPWLQIQLLRILGLLGKDDQRTSELMYDVLDESLRRAELNHNVTYAILFECVHTVYSIYPKSDLLEKAAKCIGKFVLSPKINLKYLGLKALTYVIQQDPTLALQHQMTIIECLDHPDPIIKRETLELLYRITNTQNVTVIVQKMLEYLHQSKEEYIIVNLVGKIAELAEKYPLTNSLKLEGVKKLWGKEGYLPKKESKGGDEAEAPPVPPETAILENRDQAITRNDQSQVLTQSKEEKEKQMLASSLFVGLGSENTIHLLGKADPVSHKFRRKSKVKETRSGETAHSSFSTLSNVVCADDDDLNTLHDRGDKGLKKFSLSSELLDSKSLTELPLVEKLSNCSLSAPSLFADNNMEILHPPPSTTASVVKQLSVVSSLEETTECMHSSLTEVCNNETISVSSYKIWEDDCLLMVWLVANKTDLELKSAHLEVFPAENFKITEQSGCCLPVVDAESTTSFQHRVQVEQPFTEGNLSGFLTYQMVDVHPVQLDFSINLSLLDFIRPLKISTEDFGKLWLSFANDVKQNIKTAASPAVLPSALNVLQQKLRLHVIDVVGSEGLLACRLLPSVPCLLHCRVHADVLALWFRSSCPALPDYLSRQCQKVMEGS